MPRILRIINRFNLGGPTHNVAYLTKYLSPAFETLLVGGQKDSSEGSSEFIVRELGIDPIIIPEMRRSINPLNDLIAYRKLKAIIRTFNPDIVHTHAAKAGALGRLAAIACNVPVVVHTFHGHVFHSYFGRFKTFIFKTIERYLAKKCSFIVAISATQKHELSTVHQISSPEKIEIVPLGFNLEKFATNMAQKRINFRQKYQIGIDEIAIVIVGRLVPIKNHAMFVAAIDRAQNLTKKKLRAFIVGDGTERVEIENKARALGISFVDYQTNPTKALLTFTSWIHDASEVFAGSDIVTLTSFNEGTPVSLIEAQAAGKAIVSVRVGGVEDIVIPGKTALLSTLDVTDFCAQLLTLIENDKLRLEMGEAGKENSKDKFDFRSLVNTMGALYWHYLEERS